MTEPVKERDLFMGVYVLLPVGGYSRWHAEQQTITQKLEPLELQLFRTPQEAELELDNIPHGAAKGMRVHRVKIVEY